MSPWSARCRPSTPGPFEAARPRSSRPSSAMEPAACACPSSTSHGCRTVTSLATRSRYRARSTSILAAWSWTAPTSSLLRSRIWAPTASSRSTDWPSASPRSGCDAWWSRSWNTGRPVWSMPCPKVSDLRRRSCRSAKPFFRCTSPIRRKNCGRRVNAWASTRSSSCRWASCARNGTGNR